MRKRIKSWLPLIAMVLCFVNSLPVYATSVDNVSKSYSYDYWGEAVPSPAAYEWERSVRVSDIGIEDMVNVRDIYYKNEQIYLIMDGKLVIMDNEFNLIKEITSVKYTGGEYIVSNPSGIFVTEENHIYLAEPKQGVIVHLDENWNFVREIGNPNIVGLESTTYAPTKVVVDEVGRIYVQALGIYEGIIELDPYGNYNRFVGANNVTASLSEIFWRSIATDEQLARMALWLPTSYNDLAVDKEGFVLAVVRDITASDPLKRLNSQGVNIFPSRSADYISPRGDMVDWESVSLLTSVTTADDGRIAILDATQSRIFVYNEDGYYLYNFGGSGKNNGDLSSPVDLAFMEDKLLVIDLVTKSIEVFAPTEYGTLINEAALMQTTFEYEETARLWEEVLAINPNFYYANIAIGKHYYRVEDYEMALEYYLDGYSFEYASKAYSKVREAWLDENLGYIFAGIIALLIGKWFYDFYKRKKIASGYISQETKWTQFRDKCKYEFITYPQAVISSPFKTYDDIKYYQTGNTNFCIFVLLAYGFVHLASLYLLGPLFFVNEYGSNVVLDYLTAVSPFIMFVLGTWAIGVLISGKGTLLDVFKVNMYALYPYCIFLILMVISSYFVTSEEMALIYFFQYFGLFIYCMYTFIGLTTVNQYSFFKSVGSIVLSIVAMVFMIFVIILVLSLTSNMVNSIYTMYQEWQMNI